jgi:hypothetical protein
VISEHDVEDLRKRADQTVVEAVEFADASSEPPLESLYENLYVLEETTGGWYAVDERTPETHPGERELEVGAEGEIRKLAEAGAAYAGQGSSGGKRVDSTTGRAEEDEPGPSDEAQKGEEDSG